MIVSNFFDVLFGFRRCEIRSSDLFPRLPTEFVISSNGWAELTTNIFSEENIQKLSTKKLKERSNGKKDGKVDEIENNILLKKKIRNI